MKALKNESPMDFKLNPDARKGAHGKLIVNKNLFWTLRKAVKPGKRIMKRFPIEFSRHHYAEITAHTMLS